MSGDAVAAFAGFLTIVVLTLVNLRQGWTKASSDYVASLKGLVEARDREIVDLQQENADLQQEVRRLERRVRLLEQQLTP